MSRAQPITALLLTACAGGGWQPSTPVNAESPATRIIELYDDDGDGVLSEAELEVHRVEGIALADYDADGSGALDAAEVRTALWEVPSRAEGKGSGRAESGDRSASPGKDNRRGRGRDGGRKQRRGE